jgi:outer membrane protein TolC
LNKSVNGWRWKSAAPVLSAMRQGAIFSRRQAAAAASLDRLEATTMELERGTKTITDFVLANDDYYNAAITEANAAFQRDEDLVRVAALTGLLLSIDLDRTIAP